MGLAASPLDTETELRGGAGGPRGRGDAELGNPQEACIAARSAVGAEQGLLGAGLISQDLGGGGGRVRGEECPQWGPKVNLLMLP